MSDVPVTHGSASQGELSPVKRAIVEIRELRAKVAALENAASEPIAVVGVGVSLSMKGDTVKDARVGLGAVAPTVLLVEKAAKALIGSKLEDEALEKAAQACSDACKPIDDKRGTIKYRTKIAGVLLKRAALIARDRINGIEHRGHR